MKQHGNPYSGSSPMYQDLSTCHDRPVKTAVVDFPIRLKGILKPTSSNLLSLLETQNKDLGTASQRLLIRVTLHLRHTLDNEERTLEKFLCLRFFWSIFSR